MNLSAPALRKGPSTLYCKHYTLGLLYLPGKVLGVAEGTQSQEGQQDIQHKHHHGDKAKSLRQEYKITNGCASSWFSRAVLSVGTMQSSPPKFCFHENLLSYAQVTMYGGYINGGFVQLHKNVSRFFSLQIGD